MAKSKIRTPLHTPKAGECELTFRDNPRALNWIVQRAANRQAAVELIRSLGLHNPGYDADYRVCIAVEVSTAMEISAQYPEMEKSLVDALASDDLDVKSYAWIDITPAVEQELTDI